MPPPTFEKLPLDSEAPRSPQARARAEKALSELIDRLGPASRKLVLIGGLVPQILAVPVRHAPAHLGTLDIDVGVFSAVNSYSEVEADLKALGWSPDETAPGWRWQRGTGADSVSIEFLCDLDTEANETAVQLRGCQSLFALNLRGAGVASLSWTDVFVGGGGTNPPTMQVASLEAYLIMKAHAITSRGRDKDCYDFVYVLLFNEAGGPKGAATRILASDLAPLAKRIAPTWREVGRRFEKPEQFGPDAYAKQSIQAVPELDLATLRNDACAAVALLLEGLGLDRE